jgi:hypothetical protein
MRSSRRNVMRKVVKLDGLSHKEAHMVIPVIPEVY